MISEYDVKQYCSEDISLIENYDKAINDNAQIWHCHHRLETELNKSVKELEDLDLYYNRPANELIFLTKSEHTTLHNKGNHYNLGKHLSEETKLKMSAAGKGKPKSEETKLKMSKAFKGRKFSEEHNQKLRKPKPKYKWMTSSGEIKIMDKAKAKRWHPDWIPVN